MERRAPQGCAEVPVGVERSSFLAARRTENQVKPAGWQVTGRCSGCDMALCRKSSVNASGWWVVLAFHQPPVLGNKDCTRIAPFTELSAYFNTIMVI